MKLKTLHLNKSLTLKPHASVLENYSSLHNLKMPQDYGVNLLSYGLDSCFKPWYSDGKAIYWGKHCTTRSEAEAAAKALASREWESPVL